jgi:hypothetical protein
MKRHGCTLIISRTALYYNTFDKETSLVLAGKRDFFFGYPGTGLNQHSLTLLATSDLSSLTLG